MLRKATHLVELQDTVDAVNKHITLGRCFDTLENLVRRYSPSQHERVLAEYIAGRLRDLGLEVEIQEISDESCNVVGRLPVLDSSYTCLFAGHMDTVPIVDGWVRDALRLTAEGDRLYGLGACDMKGGIAGALVALEAIVKCGLRPLGTIVVAMLADEERWSLGAKRFLKDPVKADFCLLGEPCFDKMAIGWPGKMAIDCTVKGVSGHAGRPWQGINAIDEASRYLTGLAQVTGRDLEAGYGKGVCDADYLVGEAAIPTVSFGPEGGGLHAADEWVSAEKLVVASKVYALMALYGFTLAV